jgi:hypothetical protein
VENKEIIFLTFGGPTKDYHNAVKRICSEAVNIKVFTKVEGLTEKYLEGSGFTEKHGKFLKENKRGYGYWIWKPYIVMRTLEGMKDSDILVYADAGCMINTAGKDRMLDYIRMVSESKYGIQVFELPYIEKAWTKMDLIDYLDAKDLKNTMQIQGSAFIIRKCEHTMKLISKWYEVCCIYNLVNDSASIIKNDPSFREHRHDQSIFSILCKKYGAEIIKNETNFKPNWSVAGKKYPIWVIRKRSS